jgi:hypothetical protein
MLAAALEAEVDQYIAELIGERDEQARWRAITAPRLVALVRVGPRFERGVLAERSAARAA